MPDIDPLHITTGGTNLNDEQKAAFLLKLPLATPAEWHTRVDKDIEHYYYAAAGVLASSPFVPPPLDTIQPFIVHAME
ncbi:uncharacterized protein EHS24_004063 [Apiotrichum porosum]|uniref:Uncharacterized protein n=1 Tax=Apiotrichum porosum TaxID=105984 RepID=A0A427Y473_9TREE|nr:uncharacterized protein EHS24_004063 [Apiotrichum porosum]RSH85879.1 hypothetical protein EHS24_004063 [Apiotrichum porosum]